jgi:hypothetical protein
MNEVPRGCDALSHGIRPDHFGDKQPRNSKGDIHHSSFILNCLSRHICIRILGYPHDRSEGNLRQRNVRVPGQVVEGILGKE